MTQNWLPVYTALLEQLLPAHSRNLISQLNMF
jgi:hypothetical protein